MVDHTSRENFSGFSWQLAVEDRVMHEQDMKGSLYHVTKTVVELSDIQVDSYRPGKLSQHPGETFSVS